jgi:hypothetical protein
LFFSASSVNSFVMSTRERKKDRIMMIASSSSSSSEKKAVWFHSEHVRE